MDNLLSFNINYNVYVRLTEKGRNILRSEKITIPQEDENGYSKWLLWELMYHFGSHIYNGCEVPFETTIKLETPLYALTCLP